MVTQQVQPTSDTGNQTAIPESVVFKGGPEFSRQEETQAVQLFRSVVHFFLLEKCYVVDFFHWSRNVLIKLIGYPNH